MGLSTGTRSLMGDLASLAAAATVLIAGVLHYDTVRTAVSSALGASDTSMNASVALTMNTPNGVSRTGGTTQEHLGAGADGHYYAHAEINGRPLDVMVDTGASMVALTYEDAERAGLRLQPSDFTTEVSTANGVAAVASVTLDRVTIGRITVRNVPAAVAEPGRLEKTLLGMSFLSRLARVDITSGRLTLIE